MHELSVTESILSIALQHAQAKEATRINDIYLVIGQLSSIVDDSIQFYWDFVSEATIAEKAKLHFKRIPAQFKCTNCEHEYQPADSEYSCPNCSSAQVRLTAGDEFFLEAIDIEK